MDVLDLESHQIREIYARFGLAAYQAQCLDLNSFYFPPYISKIGIGWILYKISL